MFLEKIPRIKEKLDKLVEVGEAKAVARRLFVTNSFDGLLTTIGVLLGSYIGGAQTPSAYIGAVLGGTITMGVFSGFLGALFSERAERRRELKQLQAHVMRDLTNTIYGKASRIIPYYVALWSSIGLIVFPIISLTPFFMAALGSMGVIHALVSSIASSNAMIFMLGIYIGKVSGDNVIRTGLTMLATSLAATVLLFLVSIVF